MHPDPEVRRNDADTASIIASDIYDRTTRLFKNFRGKSKFAESSQWMDDDIIIIAFGNSGSGKSTFINTAANATLPIGGGMEPCTTEVNFARMKMPEVTDRNIVLIDTPGLDTPTDAHAGNVAAFLKKNYGKKVTPSGILYFQDLNNLGDVTVGRKMWSSLEPPGTKASWPRMRLVTTRWNQMDPEDIESREKAVLSQFLDMAICPDLTLSRFDQTQKMAIQILLPFLRSANRKADCLLLEGIGRSGKSEAASLKELAGLLEQQRILLNKLCQERSDLAPDEETRRALLEKHKENGAILKSKATSMKTAKESKHGKSLFHTLNAWVWPTSYVERTQAMQEVEKLQGIMQSTSNVSSSDKVFLLLGTAGSGKSQFIFDCIGQQDSLQIDDSLISEETALPVQMFKGAFDQSDAVFIDTPGFNQASRISDAAIVTQVTSWLVVMHHKRVRLAGVVFLHKISVTLSAKEFLPCRGLLAKCLEEDVPVILATTHWDEELDRDAMESGAIDWREAGFKEDCWQGLIECGAKVKRLGMTSSPPSPSLSYETSADVIRGLMASA